MEIADFWLLDKELVHKLFKVLVPRFENSDIAYTRMYKAPKCYTSNKRVYERAVLELRNNPFPSLTTKQANNRLLLQNVLLDAAKYEYRQTKYAEMAQNIGQSEVTAEEAKDEQNNLN